MSGFVVFKKLSVKDTIKTMLQIEKWFRENPKKNVCQTDLFKVRKDFMIKDILKHSQFYKNDKII